MKKVLALMFLAGVLQTNSFAQDEKSAETKSTATKQQFYRLEFSVREVEGERTVNNREYTAILSDSGRASVRADARVPVSTMGGSYSQIGVGVHIDCEHAQQVGSQFQSRVRADITTMAESGERGAGQPIVRSNTWESDVALPMRQPTLLFSSDDPATRRKMQLVLTVTPVR